MFPTQHSCVSAPQTAQHRRAHETTAVVRARSHKKRDRLRTFAHAGHGGVGADAADEAGVTHVAVAAGPCLGSADCKAAKDV